MYIYTYIYLVHTDVNIRGLRIQTYEWVQIDLFDTRLYVN